MKKTPLVTVLILTLALLPAYAEKAPPSEADTSDAPSESSTEEPSTETSAAIGTIEDTPQMGITGSMMPFLQESFQTDLATGAGTLSIPITVPPGRKNIQPNLSLSYSSNNSNGILGVGWAIPLTLIQRSTKRGVPHYDNTDTFVFAGAGSNTELVYIGNNEYRPKIEGAFMKYTFSGGSWTVYDKSGTKYYFGRDPSSRLEDSERVFSWYLDRVEDVHGNYLSYIYEKSGDGDIYLKEIQYTGSAGLTPDKSVVFNYEPRPDTLHSYRSGWHVVTSQRLTSIEVKLQGGRVWLYTLAYITSASTQRSLLDSITVYDSSGSSLPQKRFRYSRLE